MLFSPYYAKNYAGIIDTGLPQDIPNINAIQCTLYMHDVITILYKIAASNIVHMIIIYSIKLYNHY